MPEPSRYPMHLNCEALAGFATPALCTVALVRRVWNSSSSFSTGPVARSHAICARSLVAGGSDRDVAYQSRRLRFLPEHFFL